MTDETAGQTVKTAVEFKGEAGEYFKIWIVNIFLSIVTLGIYSAWAKVRRQRYFYGATSIDGAAFEYLADPVKILKGRILMVILLAPMFIANELGRASIMWLQIYWGLFVVFLIFLPWIVIRGRMFNLRNTAYRNLRFNFKAGYGQAAKAILMWGWLSGVTLGLLYPIYLHRKQHLLIDNSYFGASRFWFDTKAGAFYRRMLMLMIYFFIIFVVLGIGAAILIPTLIKLEQTASPAVGPAIFPFFMIMGMVAFALFAKAFITAAMGELVINRTTLGPHRFHCAYKTGRLFFIYLTNTLAIAFSFGLAIPWANIRKLRYLASNVAISIDGDLDAILAAETEQMGALGEEMGESWDLDIGVGA